MHFEKSGMGIPWQVAYSDVRKAVKLKSLNRGWRTPDPSPTRKEKEARHAKLLHAVRFRQSLRTSPTLEPAWMPGTHSSLLLSQWESLPAEKTQKLIGKVMSHSKSLWPLANDLYQ